jgi:hypothetical protein
VVALNGQDSSAFTIYSAYNVAKTVIKDAGPSTVFAQQWQLLCLSGVASPDPRQWFFADLGRNFQSRVHNHEAVILVGDLNERLGDKPNLMASICGEFDLFDVHEFHHGNAVMVPTYIIRGTKCLDYYLLSPELAPFV